MWHKAQGVRLKAVLIKESGKTPIPLAPHTADNRVRCMLLLTTETRRAQRDFSCPIGRRRSGKRSQPFGQDLVHRLLHVNGWSQLKSFRRRRRLFSLAVVSRPGKKHPPLCPLCLCAESSIRPPQAVIMWSEVTNRFGNSECRVGTATSGLYK